MRKYASIFRISLAQEFAYKVNFLMWRVRNVLQILLTFFLWSTVFSDPGRVVFGYDRAKILTYVLGVLIIRAIVLASRTIDVAGEISRGDLSNHLVKPISYFKYWFTRDVSSKVLNLTFAVVEITLLFAVLKPTFFIQTDINYIFGFLLSLTLAMLVFFFLLFLVNMITFWAPGEGWSAQFLIIVIFTEFMSGSVFPLDILPNAVQKFLYLTPFPYLIFFPLQVYLGKVSPADLYRGLFVSLAWVTILYLIVAKVWKKGLVRYGGEGR